MKRISAFFEGKVIEFNGWECKAVPGKYPSGHLFINLVDTITGYHVARITLNLDNVPVIEDLIIIKSYAENAGMYEALLKHKIVKPCERKLNIGFVQAHVCFLNI